MSNAPHWRTQYALDYDGEINVDLFAGGGGASTGLEMGLKRPVHIAINHDADAISMHMANHPGAEHYQCDVFEVDPLTATRGRPVGHLHMSPDCTHHSQAAGGQPRKRAIRSLAWVGHKWAGKTRPRVLSLENVKQMMQWGPLVAKRCKATGRVIKLDGTVAAPGERTPVNEQFLVPCKKRRSQNWRHFIKGLRAMGYAVEWQTLAACDFGAPTTRDRLYLYARRDDLPIVWPQATHARKPAKGQQRYAPAASCIDWSDLGKSIFERPRPLAENTLKRIAKGIDKFVLNAAEPFIVPVTHQGGPGRVHSIQEPLRTVTAAHRGELAVGSPCLVQLAHGQGKPGGVQRWGIGSRDIEEPMNTVTGSGGMAVATAFMAQMNGGFYEGAGRAIDEPLSTITGRGTQQQIVTAHLMVQRRNQHGASIAEPLQTITAGANHHGLVNCTLSPQVEEGALRVAAFLMRYHSTGGQWADLNDPMTTITTKDRLALVTVYIKGTPYVIVDICLRMLKPRELYRAQGFPETYIIDHGHDGRRFTITAQTRMCGNSVSPLPMAALARANDHQLPAALAMGAA
ncbi:DNA cytosine methyltransferase [Vreelandella malpeensis]|uniref:DNA (cytosine-5-)-methyltransferase n=1 Tax=Vreelandella malpeensis TaxID=1172368 RepID=A0ABS8DUL1_9GAMM|nr:DNA cytosine methyltransferase [Halomonas malpeensis]MCB8889966.1 DNA cytosine methyltransferase [Halomonas malpeensis]